MLRDSCLVCHAELLQRDADFCAQGRSRRITHRSALLLDQLASDVLGARAHVLNGPALRVFCNRRHPGFEAAQLDYADGRRAVWQVCRRMAWQFHVAVYGTAGMDQAMVGFDDRYAIFRATAVRMVEFVQRRASPVPVAETIEIVRLLEGVRNAQRVS